VAKRLETIYRGGAWFHVTRIVTWVMALLLSTWPEPQLTAQAGAVPGATPATLRGAIQIAAGQQHTCALMADGRVKCWGTDGAGRRNVPWT
jgi:hypothetical protein